MCDCIFVNLWLSLATCVAGLEYIIIPGSEVWNFAASCYLSLAKRRFPDGVSRRRMPAPVGITTHVNRSLSLLRTFSLRERRPGFIILLRTLNSRADFPSAFH